MGEIELEETQDGTIFYFHLSDNTPSEEGTLLNSDNEEIPVIWKDVLVAGEYPMSPGPTGAEEKPMRVIREGKSDYASRTISMSDVIKAHEDGAFKYVTIPTDHKDRTLDNTGFVPRPGGVRIVEKDNKDVMQAALGFTEPDVKGKVQRGTIPDVSGGFFFNWKNKHKNKTWPVAMKHVCLTKIPFMGNLEPFKAAFASDDEIPDDVEVRHFQFADDVSEEDGSTGEIVWNEKESVNWVRSELEAAIRPERDPNKPEAQVPYYWIRDISTDNKALIEEEFRGERTTWLVPFTVSEDKVTPAPGARWTEVREAMIAASDDKPLLKDISVDVVLNTLQKILNDELSETYKIKTITFDERALILNTENNATWVAKFSVESDGGVYLTNPNSWERIAPEVKLDDSKPSESPTSDVVVNLSDKLKETPEGRLKLAAAKRRKLVAS